MSFVIQVKLKCESFEHRSCSGSSGMLILFVLWKTAVLCPHSLTLPSSPVKVAGYGKERSPSACLCSVETLASPPKGDSVGKVSPISPKSSSSANLHLYSWDLREESAKPTACGAAYNLHALILLITPAQTLVRHTLEYRIAPEAMRLEARFFSGAEKATIFKVPRLAPALPI
uniref:CUB and Sushi multiple domains 1 n=1 Tax=Piliocolobus tephrosceles TaxID=591936 RepID=A0A8C9H6S6_9PRIM